MSVAEPSSAASRRKRALVVAAAAAACVALAGAAAWAGPLAPVAYPPENPFSESKRVLGKILFWEEQLSSDDTMSCGTCHQPASGGADKRSGRHPGADGVPNTADDVIGSPGVVRRDASGNYVPSALFGFDRQVTGRKAPSDLTGALADSLFWDGRATSTFVDPETHTTAVASGGALESQAVGPILAPVEMAREGRTWADVEAKLAKAAPLALASNLPPDVATALAANADYPSLFRAAFGDPTIDARRIAFAIATYERTLVPDQTPWDRFIGGDASALDAASTRGWTSFQTTGCNACHTAPEFTDRLFHNIGVRPPTEDAGRQIVTGDTNDRGKFRTPSLRNAGLRRSFMHAGGVPTVNGAFTFYIQALFAPISTDNRDPLIPALTFSPGSGPDIEALMSTGLTDPRAAAETYPFDRPVMYADAAAHGPSIAGAGRAGAGGVVPKMIATMPPHLGNSEFRLGVANSLVGATAYLAVSTAAPTGDTVFPQTLVGPVTLAGSGTAGGYGTAAWPIPDDASLDGAKVYFQWRVADAAATGGTALSPVASATMFSIRRVGAAPSFAAGDADLYVATSSFAVDYGKHAAGIDADKFAVSGFLATAGAAQTAGASLTISVGGKDVVTATLDASGRAASAPKTAPAWSASVNLATGAFAATASGLDLRDAVALDGLTGAGEIDRDVRVSLVGAGLATDAASASVPFAFSGKAGKTAKGSFKFATSGLRSGAFRASSAKTKRLPDATISFKIAGILDAQSGAPFLPTGDVELKIGGAVDATLPASASVAKGSGASYSVRYVLAGAESVTFAYAAKTHAFTIDGEHLPAALLPTDASLSTLIALSIATTSARGDESFATTLVLRRASASSTAWRR